LNQEPPGRPAWKRLASGLRRIVTRLATPIDRIVRGTSDPLLPPAHLRIYYYGTWDPEAFARASEIRTELITRGLRPEHRLLDIGCGIGNIAIGLKDYLRGGYDGLDIHPEAIDWCQRTLTPQYPSFRFHRADVASRAYNPNGRVPASEYRFPFPDRSFDFIFLASVFTHMMPDEVERYVREISRLLAPGGRCVESYFLLNDETRPGVAAGRSFMSFDVPHPSGVCVLHDAFVPEAAVAFEEGFVRRIHDAAGLRIEDVRRGRWWTGERHDQDVVTAALNEHA
jgi:SAM-dependent methyltransferase